MTEKRSGAIGASSSAAAKASSARSIAAPPTVWTASDQRSRAQKEATARKVSVGAVWLPR